MHPLQKRVQTLKAEVAKRQTWQQEAREKLEKVKGDENVTAFLVDHQRGKLRNATRLLNESLARLERAKHNWEHRAEQPENQERSAKMVRLSVNALGQHTRDLAHQLEMLQYFSADIGKEVSTDGALAALKTIEEALQTLQEEVGNIT